MFDLNTNISKTQRLPHFILRHVLKRQVAPTVLAPPRALNVNLAIPLRVNRLVDNEPRLMAHHCIARTLISRWIIYCKYCIKLQNVNRANVPMTRTSQCTPVISPLCSKRLYCNLVHLLSTSNFSNVPGVNVPNNLVHQLSTELPELKFDCANNNYTFLLSKTTSLNQCVAQRANQSTGVGEKLCFKSVADDGAESAEQHVLPVIHERIY